MNQYQNFQENTRSSSRFRRFCCSVSQLPGIDINALRDLGATKGGVTAVVADSLKKVTDQNQKLCYTKIFEETGPKFRQLFDLGSKGIEKFEERVEKLG